MPVGAIATYLVALTARTSLKLGAFAALGVATADGLYALIATLSGSALAPLIEPITVPLKGISVLVLLALATRGAVTAITQHRRLQSSTPPPTTPPSAPRAYFVFFAVPQHDLHHIATPLKQQTTARRANRQLDRSNSASPTTSSPRSRRRSSARSTRPTPGYLPQVWFCMPGTHVSQPRRSVASPSEQPPQVITSRGRSALSHQSSVCASTWSRRSSPAFTWSTKVCGSRTS